MILARALQALGAALQADAVWNIEQLRATWEEPSVPLEESAGDFCPEYGLGAAGPEFEAVGSEPELLSGLKPGMRAEGREMIPCAGVFWFLF